MKTQMSFDDAWSALQLLVADIENDEIPLDELAAKVKEAKTLIKYCDERLRGIESDLKALNEDEAE